MARVNVIINCLNGEKYLQETLDSVTKQTFKDWEIIFIDNCSSDKTADIAKSFGDKLRYYRTEKTIPLGEARNLALSYVDSEWIAFLDSDDLWSFDKLEKQIKIADEYDGISLITSNFYSYNMMKGTTNIVHPSWKERKIGFNEFVCNYSYALSTFMIKKEVLNCLDSWFDNRFEYAEEYDLFCRLSFFGDAYIISEPLATRRMHSNMATLKLAKRIPLEHQMTLDNFRKMDNEFDVKYPDVVRNVNYLVNYLESKRLFPLGDNKKIRQLMKPFFLYNKRSTAYYIMACLPTVISKCIYRYIYYKSITGEEK